MEQFPAAKETQPHGPADLTDQSTVFLMLEELGIASMQRDWLEANAPESDDCKDAPEQAEEFFDDIANLFLGQGGDDRVAPNGWAGSALTKNLREAVCAYAGHDVFENVDDETVVRRTLDAYLTSLKLLTQQQEELARSGTKMSPAEYITLMIAWSGVFSGSRKALELSAPYRPTF